MFHFDDTLGGVFGHTDNGVLVCKVVTSFDSVKGVLLPIIAAATGMITQRRVNSPERRRNETVSDAPWK